MDRAHHKKNEDRLHHQDFRLYLASPTIPENKIYDRLQVSGVKIVLNKASASCNRSLRQQYMVFDKRKRTLGVLLCCPRMMKIKTCP
jgi:hypothetical protein